MTPAVPRPYAGASAEQRRRTRRAALLDAVLDVIAVKGAKGLGVKAVCTAAGLNDRYFYEQFRDCDEAVMALNDDLVAGAKEAIVAAAANSEAEAHTRLRACVAAAIDFVSADPRRGRFLIESQSTEQLRAKRQEFVTILADIMLSWRRLLGPDAPSEQDYRLIALTVISGGLDLGVMWLRGDVDIDGDRLVDFMTALFLSSMRLSANAI
ncbi:MAG: TetR/AcrR family transcriptional regulator [Mycobacterium sp.]